MDAAIVNSGNIVFIIVVDGYLIVIDLNRSCELVLVGLGCCRSLALNFLPPDVAIVLEVRRY